MLPTDDQDLSKATLSHSGSSKGLVSGRAVFSSLTCKSRRTLERSSNWGLSGHSSWLPQALDPEAVARHRCPSRTPGQARSQTALHMDSI